MAKFKDSIIFAFCQGFFEHLGGCGGRTHETNMDWNEAYDSGMNLADLITWRR